MPICQKQKNKKIDYCEPAMIQFRDVHKHFIIGDQNLHILKDLNFDVCKGDFFIIFGPSGCGKSTLLYIMLGLEPPTSGKVIFLGEDLYRDRDEDRITKFRKLHIGMVYQQSDWIKSLSVLDNVSLPLVLLGIDKVDAQIVGIKMLGKVGMEEWKHHNPAELSSGQQQKVAVARALVTNPEIIIADEPTGNLDFESGRDLLHLLGDLRVMGKTIVMVTHDLEYLQYAKNILQMKDGAIVGLFGKENRDDILQASSYSYKKVLTAKSVKQN